MKKIVFIMAFLATFLVSCSNKETAVTVPTVDVPQSTEVIALKNDLLALNNEMFGQQIDTKARWWKYLLTAIADAGVGLITGNVGFAISASSLTWTVFKDVSKTSDNNIESDPVKSVNDPVFATSYLDIDDDCPLEDNDGMIHNQVILNLYEIYGEDLFDLPEETLLQIVAEEVAAITGCTVEEVVPDIASATADMKVYTDAYLESSSIDEYIEHLKTANPEKSDALDILKITLEGFQFVDATVDNGEYATRVIEIIDNSNVEEAMKDDLKSSVSIANASARLWNTDAATEN
ncbi:MAG: hypothetical protein K2G18_05525 [Bacteroidales bacterium]|nr:hypothetical protein [Bacteroidales bacterium]